jgi:hypothetical protein
LPLLTNRRCRPRGLTALYDIAERFMIAADLVVWQ